MVGIKGMDPSSLSCPKPGHKPKCSAKLEGNFKCGIATICTAEWALEKCIQVDCGESCQQQASVCLYRGDAVKVTYQLTPSRTTTNRLCFLSGLSIINVGEAATRDLKVGILLQYKCSGGSWSTLGSFTGLEREKPVLEPRERHEYRVAGCVNFPPSGTSSDDFVGDDASCKLRLTTDDLTHSSTSSLHVDDRLEVSDKCDQSAEQVFLHDSANPNSPIEIDMNTQIPIVYSVTYRPDLCETPRRRDSFESDEGRIRVERESCPSSCSPCKGTVIENEAYLSNSCEPNKCIIPGTEVRTKLCVKFAELAVKPVCSGTCHGGCGWCLDKSLVCQKQTCDGAELTYQITANQGEKERRKMGIDLTATLACSSECRPKYSTEICLKFKVECAGFEQKGSWDKVVMGDNKQHFDTEIDPDCDDLSGRAKVKLCYKNQVFDLLTGCVTPLDDEVTCTKEHCPFVCSENTKRAILTDRLSLPQGVFLVEARFPPGSPLAGLGSKLNGKVEVSDSICGVFIAKVEGRAKSGSCEPVTATNEAKLEFRQCESKKALIARTTDQLELPAGKKKDDSDWSSSVREERPREERTYRNLSVSSPKEPKREQPREFINLTTPTRPEPKPMKFVKLQYNRR